MDSLILDVCKYWRRFTLRYATGMVLTTLYTARSREKVILFPLNTQANCYDMVDVG